MTSLFEPKPRWPDWNLEIETFLAPHVHTLFESEKIVIERDRAIALQIILTSCPTGKLKESSLRLGFFLN